MENEFKKREKERKMMMMMNRGTPQNTFAVNGETVSVLSRAYCVK